MIDDAMIKRIALECGMREPGPLSQETERFYPRDFAERMARACYAAGQRDEQRELIALAAAQGWGMRNNDPFEDSVREICDMRACTEDKTNG